MHYTFFEIENYRGVRSLRLDLGASATGDVYTLVGLNESGKTTILEAIGGFSPGSETTDPEATGQAADPFDLVPISERDNFNGAVVIRAGVDLTSQDQAGLTGALERRGYLVDSAPESLTIEVRHEFERSTYVDSNELWDLAITGKTRRAKLVRTLDEDSNHWQVALDHVVEHLPRIRFFPDFLFDIPDRLLIGRVHPEPDPPPPGEEPKRRPTDPFYRASRAERYYAEVLQDILDSLERSVNVREHLFNRAASGKRREERSLKQLLNNMQREITQTVFGSWDVMFGRTSRPASDKRLILEVESEEEEDGATGYYLRWQIEDSNGLSDIGERSLGFRWFFVYRLLTAYRGRRRGSPPLLFLFDEPASNLHPGAQGLLLESFEKLSRDGNVIISTHSHHLINPDWLSRCYIVKNEGIDYGDEIGSFVVDRAEIGLHPYHRFANENPTATSYFQPILDTLDYRPSALELVDGAVMLEGRWDFYSLRYVALDSESRMRFSLVPGTGAGSLDLAIQLYLGWGRDFVVLLDSDSEGERQRQRYLDKFGRLMEDRVFLLDDVNERWGDKAMEDLFNVSDRLAVQELASNEPQRDYDKKRFNRGLEVAVATRQFLGVGKQTAKNFDALADFLADRLEPGERERA